MKTLNFTFNSNSKYKNGFSIPNSNMAKTEFVGYPLQMNMLACNTTLNGEHEITPEI